MARRPDTVVAAVEYVYSQKGRRMIRLNNYTYSATSIGRKGQKVRWRCSTHHNHGCSAAVWTFDCEETIIAVKDQHTHPPILKHSLIMVSSRGTRTILLDGYTYHHHVKKGAKTRWRCRSGHDSCKAVVFTIDDDVVMQKGEHNHPPILD
ncbi:FLYWCH zinc finger domain-containing protein [Phthorimaea operculella]|nr:FLYWCH zinc finger domain-containing protein [Phthorimaea operculella]